MSCLHIARFFEFASPSLGGASISEFLVCKGLAELGHEIELYTSDMPPGRYLVKNRYPAREIVNGVKITRLRAIVNVGGDAPLILSPRKLAGLNVDIIHAHEYYQPLTVAACLTSLRKGTAFTFTQERYYDAQRKHWRIPFWVVDSTLCRLVRKTARRAVAFAEASKNFLAEKGYLSDKIEIIPMCVDTDLFKPKSDSWFRNYLSIGSGAPLILTVARLHPSKGLENLLRVMRHLKDYVPTVKLAIVGRGPSEYSLKREIVRENLEESVSIVTEPIPYFRMADVYNSCDVFVLPSIYEPFGLAVVEAMACGKPVIVSDVGGMKDMVINGADGFKIPIASELFIHMLQESLVKLLKDAQLRETLGRAARERAVKGYNWKIVAKKYENLYNRVLTERQ